MLNESNFVISLEDDDDDVDRERNRSKQAAKWGVERFEQPEKYTHKRRHAKFDTQLRMDSTSESIECNVLSESPAITRRKRKENEKSRKKKGRHPPLLRRRPIIERMGIPFGKFRTSANKRSMPQSISRYRRSVKLITRKIVKADKTWVGFMISLGTIDLIVNIANFVQMTDSNLEYGLVIGPPSTVLWQLLLAFTIVSWFLYIFETVNSFSLLYNISRETYLPIPYDLIITLIFKHIPLSTIVYFISKSRRDYTTGIESICNGFRIFYILMRLVWYAQIEGRKIRKNDKYVIEKTFIFLCCLLFSVATSFAVQNWRKEPSTILKRYHLINVSIVMLHEDTVLKYIEEHRFPPEKLKFNYSVKNLLQMHGYNVEKPWLVKSLLPIKDNNGTRVVHTCSKNMSTVGVSECPNNEDYLIFLFLFREPSFTSPFGEINYNYAKATKLPEGQAGANSSMIKLGDEFHECEDSSVQLMNDFQLYYLEFSRTVSKNGTSEVFITAPFRKSWTHPKPRYDPEIKVCTSNHTIHNFPEKKTKMRKKYTGRTIYFPVDDY